jgi:hypothetical protein
MKWHIIARELLLAVLPLVLVALQSQRPGAQPPGE